MFPPKKQLYPAFFSIAYIIEVVVVFPSVPVIPITLQGANFKTISISDVSIAPCSTAFSISGLLGIQLGDLNIIS